jgi:hypothetical protein
MLPIIYFFFLGAAFAGFPFSSQATQPSFL